MNFPIEIYTIIIECLLIFYFFHKEVRPVWLDTDLNISPVDLYIIIGNTMDNAIEACDAFPAGHKPSISCTLRQKNHVLLYEISNPIPQVSVKKAGDIHGYGLENVKECVNRNSGFISVNTENDIFCVSITLNV